MFYEVQYSSTHVHDLQSALAQAVVHAKESFSVSNYIVCRVCYLTVLLHIAGYVFINTPHCQILRSVNSHSLMFLKAVWINISRVTRPYQLLLEGASPIYFQPYCSIAQHLYLAKSQDVVVLLEGL